MDGRRERRGEWKPPPCQEYRSRIIISQQGKKGYPSRCVPAGPFSRWRYVSRSSSPGIRSPARSTIGRRSRVSRQKSHRGRGLQRGDELPGHRPREEPSQHPRVPSAAGDQLLRVPPGRRCDGCAFIPSRDPPRDVGKRRAMRTRLPSSEGVPERGAEPVRSPPTPPSAAIRGGRWHCAAPPPPRCRTP